MRNANPLKALALLSLLALPARAARADVSIVEAFPLGDAIVFRTHQGDLRLATEAGAPPQRLGNVKRKASPFLWDGRFAWAVVPTSRYAEQVTIYRIDGEGHAFGSMIARMARGRIPERITGVRGADDLHLYLDGGLRVRLEDRVLESGHLDEEPGTRVLQVFAAGGRYWYLVARVSPDSPVPSLHIRSRDMAASGWREADLGWSESPPRILVQDGSLFAIGRKRILELSTDTMRLRRDLTPMIPSGAEVLSLNRDGRSFWLLARNDADDSVNLWQIDADVLDGSPFHSQPIPANYRPLLAQGDLIWYGSAHRKEDDPVASVAKADGTATFYEIESAGRRSARRFGSGLGEAAAGTGLILLGLVTLPIWAPVAIVWALVGS